MAPSDPATQEQLNTVISMLKEQSETLKDTRKLLSENQAKVVALEAKVDSLEARVVSLEDDVVALKDGSNFREQQLKLCSVRIHGLPVTDEELAATDGGKTLANKVYDRILKPILNAAKAKNDIPSVPHCPNVIEEVYRAGRPSKTGKPAPIVVKMVNRNLRLAVLKNKRTSIPAPQEVEKNEFVKRFTVVEDLTGPTFRLLKLLQEHDSVARAWTIDGQIRFVKEDKLDTVVKVKSAFMPIESVLSLKK
jgi:hypothetical protein